MHFKMGNFTEYQTVQNVPRLAKQQQNRTSHHQYSKSEPFDANDLRRRLHIVIAEQNMRTDQRRRPTSEPTQADATEEQVVIPPQESFASRTNPKNKAAYEMLAAWGAQSKIATEAAQSTHTSTKECAAASPDASAGRTWARNAKEALPRKPSKLKESHSESSETDEPYRHVPQVAASQFARTATADNMRNAKKIHKLSVQGLLFRSEESTRENTELDSNRTPAKDKRTSQSLTGSKGDKVSQRKQHEELATLEETGDFSHASGLQNRHTFPIASSASLHAVGAGKKESYVNGDVTELPAKEGSGEELSEVDLAFAIERRDDWTKSDERSGMDDISKISTLRKMDSKWTLRGRLGGRKRDPSEVQLQVKPDEFQDYTSSTTRYKSPKSGLFSRFRR